MDPQQPTPPDRPRDIVGFTIGFESALILLAFLLGWLMDVSPLERIGGAARASDDLRAVAIGAVAILPLMLVLVVIRTFPWNAFRKLNQVVDETIVPFFKGASLFGLAIVSLAAGVGEELLFRGVLQAKFQAWWNPTVAIALSALLFGICHWMTTSYAIVAALIGVYMSILLERYDNLLVPITAHALYDFLALLLLLRGRRSPA